MFAKPVETQGRKALKSKAKAMIVRLHINMCRAVFILSKPIEGVTRMKKIISVALTICMVLCLPITVFALSGNSLALISAGDVHFSGSGQIIGDAEIQAGTMIEGNGILSVTGTAYLGKNAVADESNISTDDKLVATAPLETPSVIAGLPSVKAAPDADFFSSSTSGYTDGTKNIITDWSNPEVVINDNVYANEIVISYAPNRIIIDTTDKDLITIRVKKLSIYNELSIVGDGAVAIYVENLNVGNYVGTINASGSSDNLALICTGTGDVKLIDFSKVNATVLAPNAASFTVKVPDFCGNIYTAGNFSAVQEAIIRGYVFAPESASDVNSGAHIYGQLVTASLNISGGATIEYAPGKASDLDRFFGEQTGPIDPVDPIDPIDPIEPIEPSGKTVSVGIVTPKKMSVRFEDGNIYYGGESIDLEVGKIYRFQMCSNNWDNDIYDDNGNGLCGTVVYSVRVSDSYTERSYDPDSHTFVLPFGDPVLRTDVNTCFMAYRYHFEQGDYNKQTGIKNVVNTPLESLSVNLPLGSTVTSDAYRALTWIDSADVFIENNNGEGMYDTVYLTCVNDYYWQY